MLLHCNAQEAAYNPFYALLGARLCAGHREVKFALHFALWDAFKEVRRTSR